MPICARILLVVSMVMLVITMATAASTTNGGQIGEKIRLPDEQKLLNGLLKNYDTAARPVYNASHTVTVKLGLTLIKIADVDEVNQVMTTNVWFDQEWVDERLKWDPKDINGLAVIRIPCQRIWLPDIVLYNSVDFTEEFMQSKAMVSHDGNVFWSRPATLRSSCNIDITYFPFDDQKCPMNFGSWTYDGFQVNITNRSANVDLSNYVHSIEWESIGVSIVRNEVFYACCPEPYPDVSFFIIMRRRPLYYLFNIIFPCLWLTILSLLSFWMPPDSREKTTLGMTTLLAFSVFMLLSAESMPATSVLVPLLGIYLTGTMAIISLSIVLTVFVLQLHHVGPDKKPVPVWIRKVVLHLIARMMCMSPRQAKTPVSKQEGEENHQDVVKEWPMVAHVMDRFLFCLLLIGSFLFSLSILVLKPMMKAAYSDL